MDNTGHSIIDALSANVLETKFDELDDSIIRSTKDRVIDVLGCAIGGANAAGNRELAELVKDWGGKKDSTVLVHGGKFPAQNAAMVNAIMARSFDFEVMTVLVEGRQIPSHHAPTIVMTALALSEAVGANGREFITAVTIGDDITARIIAGSGSPSPMDPSLGWDGTGTYTAMGATAVAGRLLGLTQNQMRNAFGIVLNNIASSIQALWDGATTFKYGQGMAARNGILAAELAKKGWKGADDALLGRFGFYTLYTHGCTEPDILTKDLGKKYYAEAIFKAYPCCRATHATIDAALAIVSGNEIIPDDIEEVTVYVPERMLKGFIAKPFIIREYPHCDAIFSLWYTCATALLRKSVKQEHFTEKAFRDIAVNRLIGKMKLAALPENTLAGSEVRIKMKDGREFSEFVSAGKGDALDWPLSKEEILAKYMSQVEYSQTVAKDNAVKLLGELERLEQVKSLSDIVGLLVV